MNVVDPLAREVGSAAVDTARLAGAGSFQTILQTNN